MMIARQTVRLIAAVAAPLALLHGAPARCRTPVPARAEAGAAVTLPHISIAAMGQGSPVVLIPGLSSPREVWSGIAPRLAARHRVLLVQVNGFGGDAPGSNLVPGLLDGVVADLNGYLARQRLGRADVIGHSLGGLLALMLAKAHPDAVGKLMIVDALPFVGEIFVPGATVAALQPQAAAMRDRMAGAYGKPANPGADAAVAAGQALTPAAQARVAGWIAAADARVNAQALYEDLTTDLRPDMGGIAAPITLLFPWSARLPRERAEPLYRAAYAKAPRVTFVDVADSGHFIMLDQPAAFAAAIDAFLG